MSARLKRLGVVKGARKLKPAPPLKPDKRPFSPSPDKSFSRIASRPEQTFDDINDDEEGNIQPLETLLPGGKLVETAEGDCFVLDQVYPLSYRHGNGRLIDLITFTPQQAQFITKDDRFAELDFRDFLFVDTETTGLAGAGTLAFMVGVGFFEANSTSGSEAFVVRQYFLRDHGDEPAMLLLLDELLQQKKGLISFNGRSFDIPLLDGRFLMNRLFSDLTDLPHFDLLHPARRLWRNRLGSCALGALEPNLLGIERTHEDVPGWLIPSLYNDYLRSGNARELVRVFLSQSARHDFDGHAGY
ncbi:MAG: ribonuclease H-like domain-containing protein [Chloroflexota bacterium]